jgi:hypothetical protein
VSEPAETASRLSSWADDLHQRARATVPDQELESRVRAFVVPGEVVTMQHFIAERRALIGLLRTVCSGPTQGPVAR